MQRPAPDNERGAGSDSSGRGSSLLRWLPLLLLVGALVLALSQGWHKHLSLDALAANRDWLQDKVAAWGWLAGLAFVGLYALATALSVPGASILTITGGFLFGTWLGGGLAVVGATIGATLVFLAAKTALGDALRARAGGALERMRAGFQEDAFSYLLVLRLVPLFPFWLVNLVPAFLGVSLAVYVPATFLGIIPGGLVYASVGNGLGALIEAGGSPDLSIIFKPQILGPILGLALLAMIPVAYKRWRRSKAEKTSS